MSFSPIIEQLVESLRCLPGVGRKTAQRMALHLLERDREGVDRVLADVRRLPSRDQLLAELGEPGEVDRAEFAVAIATRRLLVAAILVFAVSLLALAGLLKFAPETDKAKASGQELRELDRRIEVDQAGKVGPIEERKR